MDISLEINFDPFHYAFWTKDPVFGLPVSGPEFLAMQNPRPIGLVLGSTNSAIFDYKSKISAQDFVHDLHVNSGIYIQLLLRRHDICPDYDEFIKLFIPFDKSLQTLHKRFGWVSKLIASLSKKKKEKICKKLLFELQIATKQLEKNFIQWAKNHQKEIVDIYIDTAMNPNFREGNAKKDCANAPWKESDGRAKC